MLSLMGFCGLNKSRSIQKEAVAYKVFSSYKNVLGARISEGYFVCDDMYKAVLDNDKEFINKNLEHIKSTFNIQTIKSEIIDKSYDGKLEYLVSFDNERLSFDFMIFDSQSKQYIKDKIIRIYVDIDEILSILGLDTDFDITLSKENQIRFIYKDSLIKIIYILLSISIAILFMYIYHAFEKLSISNHYDVEGLESIINILSKKDGYTARHSLEVADIAVKIAKELRVSRKDIKNLYKAAILHDIGKIGIPEHILNKKGRLTEDEFLIMKQHPQLSYDIVSQFPSLNKVAHIVKYHHEMIDGSGYPQGLKGKQIPFLSQILTVADIFNALTTDRSYRNALTDKDALNMMKNMPLNQEIVNLLEKIITSKNVNIKQSKNIILN